jgi:putative oxidoreductase
LDCPPVGLIATVRQSRKEVEVEVGLLVLRVVTGALFAGHGIQKLVGRFGGAGLDGTGAFFEDAGLRPGRTTPATS